MARPFRRTSAFGRASAFVLLAGCGIGDGDLETVDPAAAPLHPTYEAHIAPLM